MLDAIETTMHDPIDTTATSSFKRYSTISKVRDEPHSDSLYETNPVEPVFTIAPEC
jgi:hypothetical protein